MKAENKSKKKAFLKLLIMIGLSGFAGEYHFYTCSSAGKEGFKTKIYKLNGGRKI